MERLPVAEVLRKLHVRCIFFPEHGSKLEGMPITQLCSVPEAACSTEYQLKNFVVKNNILFLEFGVCEQGSFINAKIPRGVSPGM